MTRAAQANVHDRHPGADRAPHARRQGADGPDVPNAVIGVWGAAYRQKATLRGRDRDWRDAGPWVQVSRLGNPLFNEVIVPMSRKDEWNSVGPDDDRRFAKYVARPELAALLPVLYPGVFPNLAALKKDRADLLAILLTGIPSGLIPGFQNFTGTTQADEPGSTSPSRPPPRPTGSGCWAATSPGSPTAGA